MVDPQPDMRSSHRKMLDEKIAAEPPIEFPELPAESKPRPLEEFLPKLRRRPVAVAGIVENGRVRPLDSQVKLAEHARVIIVTSEAL